MIASCEDFDRSLGLQCSDVCPDGDAALISKTQLSLGVVSATIDIILVSETQRVIGASRDHNYPLA